MDLAALRDRVATSYRTRRDRALDLVDRIPVLGRLLSEFVRIEFIDRCMLIAAQGLLALIPMLVVLSAFLPQVTGDAVGSFTSAAGVGGEGTRLIEDQVSRNDVRTQTGLIGLAITIFSATSFARAVQRMYERIWERRHVGGMTGARRCLLWLLGWLMTLQLAGALRRISADVGEVFGGPVGDGLELAVQGLALSLIWWATSWVLLFGRVAWRHLLLGALLTGCLGVVYNRGSSLVMPPYVEANADQFGTLGVILAVSTWLIGFAAIMVAAALVGRILSEDPTVRRVVTTTWEVVEPRLPLPRRRDRADGRAAPPTAG
ncbi:YhjD/YihY/BrkB family envelope integrity protein [Nocardioides sp. YIM 152315]|uniref:YhjD/YihY/BrkB family envelope integrity protein n=1 Tax=Nocardioides sp. YIM 152315 TaxID=3031760 RepID=UPI0023D9936F|nr:YhjD/YihY/BrkB family envelope integrity protein [Nocardioides sp. YIM 152315]MDF1604540.1 YhjD/YihY/BrkB family envelope integrity protein [Nocardioides sp. YIM 152315]